MPSILAMSFILITLTLTREQPAELELEGPLRGWPVVVFSRKAKQLIKTTTAVAGAIGLSTATYALGRRHSRLRT